MRHLALALFLPSLLLAGDKAEAMPMPKLTPHHESMKALEGTWDAEVRSSDPGQAEQVSKGVEIVKLVSGGFWAMVDFKGDFGGMPFEGHGLFGYDSEAKHHVSTWVDSMDTAMAVTTGRCDGQCKRVVYTFKAKGMAGKLTDYKEVMEVQDADHRSMEMSCKVNGKFVKMMTITYTRRK